jgi:hypothetical protein
MECQPENLGALLQEKQEILRRINGVLAFIRHGPYRKRKELGGGGTQTDPQTHRRQGDLINLLTVFFTK